MSDERARILKLLEDGKITADQAARLIEALGPKRTEFDMHGPMPPITPMRALHRRHGLKELDRIPDMVAHAVTSAMKSEIMSNEEGRRVFAGKRALSIKSVSGDVEVAGWEEDNVSLNYSGGMVKSHEHEEDEGVRVRSVSGDIEARMPQTGHLDVETVSGDVTVDGVAGRVGIKTVSGDISVEGATEGVRAFSVSGDLELRHIAGELGVETRSGDVDLTPAGQFSGSLSTKSGDVTLALRPDADVVLELACEHDGEVTLDIDFPHEVLEQRENYARVKLGAGSRTLDVHTGSGDIVVQKTEED
jgi:DUF4097 and DUF4098 domain-containing protein YvlB